jgi:mono/diheme cytochrome c family protein
MRISLPHFQCGKLVKLAIACLLAFYALAVSAQEKNAASTNNPKWNYTELTKAPEKARTRTNPFEHDSDAVLAGGKLFELHCAECHGKKAEGGKRGPSLLREQVQQATPGTLFWILTNGVVWHGMPVWSKLPEPQRWQIVAFLKSFRVLAGPQN